MKKLIYNLDKFWFTEAPATRLATLRILIGAFALIYLAPRYSMLMDIAQTSHTQFEPVGIISLLLAPLPVAVFQMLVILTLAANVAFLLGWQHRITGAAFAFLLLFVLSYRNSWTMIFHTDNVLVWHVLILGLTRAADAFSLDAWRESRQLSNGDAPLDSPVHWRYGWAINLMCAVTVTTYFLAGVAKLAGPDGLNWMTGEVMRSQLAVDNLRKELLTGEAPATFGWLFNNLFLFTMMGIGTFVMELGAPLALANKWLGRLWSIFAFIGHWGIYIVMGITFRYQLYGVIFAPFFPVERPVEWAIEKVKPYFLPSAIPKNQIEPGTVLSERQLTNRTG